MSVKSEIRQEFVDLGESMKNYVVAAVSTIIVLIIAVAIIASQVFMSTMGFRLSWIIAAAAIMVISIFVTFGFYLSFISRLGKAGRVSGYPDLMTAHNYYLGAIIVGIVGVLLIIFVPLGSLMTFMSTTMPTPRMVLDVVVPIVVGAVLIGLVPAILNILGAFRLNAWANWYAFSHGASFTAKRIYDGSNLIKWGAIVTIIPMVSIVGAIMSFVGFYQTGAGFVSEFERATVPSEQVRREVVTAPMPMGTQTTQEGTKNIPFVTPSVAPNVVPTVAPTSTPSPLVRFCGKCGSRVETDNARFCVTCGSSL